MNIGLLLLRFIVGLVFFLHGSQKLFGWFDGHGLMVTAQWMETIGLKPGIVMAALSGTAEVFGGILFMLGLYTKIASGLLAIVMCVAILTVHWPNGFWNANGGFEYNLVLLAIVISFTWFGAGKYSLDERWR